MSGKNKIIFIGGALILLLVFSLICFCLPSLEISLNGEKNIKLNVNDHYYDLGAEAYLKRSFALKKVEVTKTGKVDTSKIGDYEITYSSNYFWLHKTVKRIVHVLDLEAPQLVLKSSPKYCKANNLISLDIEAYDNYDGDLSNEVKYKINDDYINIKVADKSNNVAELEEKIQIIDQELPVIKLKGSANISLNVGSSYNEDGATASDSCDGNITDKIKVTGNVDTSKAGTYEIIYSVKDSSGNEKSVKRTIYVNDNKVEVDTIPKTVTNGIIYLTFDDGPGPYTSEILSILDRYNVKATFFVTNQFPNYKYLIGTEYQKGHTVGIHTYSHKWSIYDSVDTYLDDFNKILNIIVEQTGTSPKYFRFPGGSSNTVSRSHSKGIMTELSKIMTEKGYIYYDWTFDSGDTSKKNNSVDSIIKNVKRNLKGNGEYIILMHDIKKNTLTALPTVIEYGQSLGYKFKAIDDNSIVPHFKIAN